jgi:hypothetical protein
MSTTVIDRTCYETEPGPGKGQLVGHGEHEDDRAAARAR